MRVNLIRRQIVRAEIEGETAQWMWEFAVSGVPNQESGMILSLPKLDEFLRKQIEGLGKDFLIPSAQAWMSEKASLAATELLKEALGESPKVAWQRLISSTTEHFYQS